MYKSILVPLDGSESSERALHFAAAIATAYQARLILLTVPHGQGKRSVEGVALAADRVSLMAEPRLLHAAENYLQRLATAMADRVPRVEAMVVVGDPAEIILKVAEGEKIDLIVMSTHGREGVQRLLLGSITEKVARAAPCPVLAVRQLPSIE